MSQSYARIADIVLPVAAGATDSNTIDLTGCADAIAFMFTSLAGLDANTYTIMVSADRGVTFTTLQMVKSDTGTLMDYPFPAAGKSMVISRNQLAGVTHLKIHSGGAIVTTAKTIQLSKTWEGM